SSSCPSQCNGVDDSGADGGVGDDDVPNAVCTNNDTCECAPGYSGDPNTGTCDDIDECTLGTDQCDANADCLNTPGGYFCACKAGYVKDENGECVNLNECA